MSDPVTAEDVVEAARLLLQGTNPLRVEASDPDDERAPRAFWGSVDRLRDLLSRYDAQPRPRWLKPTEVPGNGAYWVWDDSGKVLPPEHVELRDGLCYTPGPYVVAPYCPIRFYGPLPEPPAPEEE